MLEVVVGLLRAPPRRDREPRCEVSARTRTRSARPTPRGTARVDEEDDRSQKADRLRHAHAPERPQARDHREQKDDREEGAVDARLPLLRVTLVHAFERRDARRASPLRRAAIASRFHQGLHLGSERVHESSVRTFARTATSAAGNSASCSSSRRDQRSSATSSGCGAGLVAVLCAAKNRSSTDLFASA